jgi:hypothetical protein
VTVAYRQPLIPRPTVRFVQRAFNEGLFGRSRLWRTAAYAIIARRALRHVMRSDARTVAIEKIRPGETVILRGVTASDPPSR